MFRLAGSERIYVLTCCGVQHVGPFAGWVRRALVPDWADDLAVIEEEVPADVRAWLEGL